MSSEDVSRVDVLVIGAGPSGLMLSTWLARLGIQTRIIDKRLNKVHYGQADGLQSRTFEILDSLGIGQTIWSKASRMIEIRFWNPNEHNELQRSDTIVDTLPGLSRFQQATLHQAHIEDGLLGYIQKHSDIEVEYGLMPEHLSIDTGKVEADNEHPVTVTLRHLPRNESELDKQNGTNESNVPNGLYRSNLTADTTDAVLQDAQSNQDTRTETVLAKYVVGCDGAHSWTRRQIGSVMEGEQTDFIWGVLDIIPITDFPDIRYRCAIHSEAGSMMVIPREDKYVRLYIQVTAMNADGEAVDRFKVTPENLLDAARKILAPYKLSYKHCQWWTAYRIGQRVGSKFSVHNRVFLAGDAVHTHSPKAGQGMNISMHDTYNLGWKLASVIKGRANRSILETYNTERRQIAQELIDFDRKFSRLFSGRPSKDILDQEGVDLETFKRVFDQGNLFTSGCAVNYAPSLIVRKQPALASEHNETNGTHGTDQHPQSVVGKQTLASKIPIGMRIPSYKVLNQADARPWHLQELLPSNGTWRILVFAGDISKPDQRSRYEGLGKALDSPDSFIHRYGGQGGKFNSIFEVVTIHAAPRNSVELLSLPDVFHPFNEDIGWDYWKVYVDDISYHEGHGQAYENYGINPRTGCVVIVRPDQYVSWIGELEDVDEMDGFFGSFMIPAKMDQ
ncbi:uncharacterized protein Z518_10923 [Rhinocladiella mackenziei CBS 650.93]|uniref:Rhinocladiella mackenziei CBS 650.93 unplaced genomic scaffold supercont1.10, whole genome shotgun sequence n=1 Tax=Rhinocladiella mackenziei CBS 650.93 TaxID=1442369 RepID=A0A0D2I9S9_9EURO|nr:uncharacterized protein Z518_10923 [Rhinocladiella mackenziei CBS 650.93]KIW99995.1 hypothetical protein Z518_10923 [Rhinocladiella mackenziei CBS 650.93]